MHLPHLKPRLLRAAQFFMTAAVLVTAGCSSDSYLYSESRHGIVRDVYGNPVLQNDGGRSGAGTVAAMAENAGNTER